MLLECLTVQPLTHFCLYFISLGLGRCIRLFYSIGHIFACLQHIGSCVEGSLHNFLGHDTDLMPYKLA